MVAQTNNNYAVVGYSDKGGFDAENIPPQLRVLMNWYEDSLRVTPVDAGAMNHAPTLRAAGAVPLLYQKGISLNQFNHEEAGGCPTGCVATAYSQIMAYYQYPNRGIGSHCYNTTNYGQLCADFGNTTYNWNNPTGADYKKLGFHIGVALDMQYCVPFGSATSGIGDAAANRLREHFGYYTQRIPYNNNLLTEIIDEGFPLYAELFGTPVGHAIVIDGYDSRGWLHFNFGWGGDCNGYFLAEAPISRPGMQYLFNPILSIALVTPTPPKPLAEQDSLALTALYNNHAGQDGWEEDRWNLSKPMNTWRNVTIVNGRVAALGVNMSAEFQDGKPQNFDIPAEIGNLTGLYSLSIHATDYNNGVEQANGHPLTIPQSIGALTKLEELTIGSCKGELPQSFWNLNRLRGIYLSGRRNNPYYQNDEDSYLTGTIPPEIGNFSFLTKLMLQNNLFTGSIPPEIANCVSLSYVDLSGNQFTGNVPAVNSSSISTLILNNNQLTGITAAIGGSSQLTTLKLDNNLLTALPEGFSALTNLTELTLNNNRLTALPDDFGRIGVPEIDLSHNLLSKIPEKLYLNKTENLNISYNNLDTLPDDFGFAMHNLKQFNFEHNNIATFPEYIRQIAGLKTINGNNNRLSLFPDFISENITGLHLDSNYISGKFPEEYVITAKKYSSQGFYPQVFVNNNYLTFEDVPATDSLFCPFGKQAPFPLNKTVVKASIGDTLRLNIKQLAPHFTLSSNQYYWKEYAQPYSAADANDSILKMIVNENVIGKSYYCIVKNPACPKWYFKNNYTEWSSSPVLEEVVTTPIRIELQTEEEFFAEQYPNTTLLLSKNIPSGGMTNETVTLVPPFETRGALAWQMSADGNTWVDASLSMTQQDLKTNIQSIAEKELVIRPKTPAFYRLKVTDEGCDPIYSDTLKINPYGNVIFDQVISVTDSTGYIVAVDSISISIPEAFYEGDFRLTIVKLAQAPGAGQMPDGEIGSIYDVTVSCGDVIDKPLDIMLKTNKVNRLTDTNIDNFSAVYFDNAQQEWVRFDDAHISLEDGCIYIETYHLTPIADHYFEGELYDRYFSVYDEFANPQEIRIYYKDKDETYFDLFYRKVNQPWNTGAEHPAMIYDVAHYLRQAIDSVAAHGLPYKHVAKIVSSVSGVFCVYIHYQETAQAYVDMCGKALGYIVMHREFDNPQFLAKTLAHEYMHYTQTPYTNSIFWGEAQAILTDKFVYDRSWLRQYEAEDYLLDGLTARKKEDNILEYLRTSWDYWDRFTNETKLGDFGNRAHCYQAGTFLHYMQSCRSGVKFDPAQFLKGSVSNTMGRSYLASYISSNLGSTIGDEYDGYLRYIMSGEDKWFTLLRRTTDDDGNPILSEHLLLQDLKLAAGKTSLTGSIFGEYYTDKFATLVNYNFKDFNPVKQTVEREIPYLASHIVILENNTPEKSVVVQYKRLHTANANHKVYYAKFNVALKQYEYTDLSDSLQYSILLAPPANNSFDYDKANNDNSCFLLLVNKENPSWYQSGKWQASFELNAAPVPDLSLFAWLAIQGSNNDHTVVQYNFTVDEWKTLTGNSDANFYLDTDNSSPTAPNNFYSNIVSTQSMKGDSILIYDFSRQEDEGSIVEHSVQGSGTLNGERTVTGKTERKEQASAHIEYNFMTGEMHITGNNKRIETFTETYGTWVSYDGSPMPDWELNYNNPENILYKWRWFDLRPRQDTWERTWDVKLQNVFVPDFISAYMTTFTTKNSAQTQDVIDRISYTCKWTSELTGRDEPPKVIQDYYYTGIDYNKGQVVLTLSFRKR